MTTRRLDDIAIEFIDSLTEEEFDALLDEIIARKERCESCDLGNIWIAGGVQEMPEVQEKIREALEKEEGE
jgi:hypothetical protein